jgi:hypothetical protein
MIFKYYLDNSGWAGIVFEHGDFSRNYAVEEYLSDDLTELLEGMISLAYGGIFDGKGEKITDDIHSKWSYFQNSVSFGKASMYRKPS